jgi:PAT family beta-lactamase induction signal transducer AmpG
LFVNGYRIGMIISGALALMLADYYSWQSAYLLIAFSFIIGLVTTIFSDEPINFNKPQSITASVIEPIKDFFSTKNAWYYLLFILLFKVGDSMASAMTTPYILTKTDYAIIAKSLGMGATILGGLLAGFLLLKISINKALWIFGFFQAISTLFFILLISFPGNKNILSGVVTFEFLAGGAGATVLTAYMSSLTNKAFSATQFALLSSLLGVPRVIFGAYTGYMVSAFGWSWFFIFCTLVAVPGMLLLFKIARWK